jgi:methylmalonyl-CoA mutase N-terminal domain/subunit
MKEEYGARDPRSWGLRFHAQTAGAALTAQQPENNVVRVAIQALAAVLGGTQSLHTNSMDEALALPSEKSARIALRTQQIIAEETGVANTVDPAGGSYLLEELTKEIEEEARGYLDRIASMGGALGALERGFVQGEIAEAAYRYQREVEEGQRVVVGVNQYVTEGGQAPEILRLDPRVIEGQSERIAEVRGSRDSAALQRAMAHFREGAEGQHNLVPRVLAAVEAGGTLGEVSDVLREVFGVFRGGRSP